MDNMDFYNAIFTRKSIRSYKNEPLDSSRLQMVQDYMEKITPLYQEIKNEVVILSEDEVRLLLPIKSPQYIAFYSETKEGWLQNAGYMLQQLDLFLSMNGIGACWLGMGMPKKAMASRNGLEFVITMAFGTPDGPLYRNNISEFKRKTLSEISSVTGAEELLEPVRLAPSASNTQPWDFSGDADSIIINRKIPNMLKAALYGKFNRIDMGIALCHLQISAVHLGKSIEFTKEAAAAAKGYEYITTAKLVPANSIR